MTKIAFEMNPEEALRLLIDAGEILDAMETAEELVPGHVQGGLHAVSFIASLCAAVFDAEYFGGAYANDISLNQVEDGI